MTILIFEIIFQKIREISCFWHGSVQIDFVARSCCSWCEISSAGRKGVEVKEIAIAKKKGTRGVGRSRLASSEISSNASASGLRS